MIALRSFTIVIFSVFFLQSTEILAQSEALKKVETLILQDAYSQAVRECEKILVHHQRATIKAKAHYLLGICLLKEARFEEARKNFNKILQRYARSKFYDDACLGIADSYFLAGDFKQASISYKQFLQDFPRSELASIAGTHLEQSTQGKHFANSYFSVQVGCFTNKSNTERLRDKLIDRGHQAYILELPSDGLYRVRVGRFSNRLQAELLEQKLKAEGFPTKVCP